MKKYIIVEIFNKFIVAIKSEEVGIIEIIEKNAITVNLIKDNIFGYAVYNNNILPIVNFKSEKIVLEDKNILLLPADCSCFIKINRVLNMVSVPEEQKHIEFDNGIVPIFSIKDLMTF